MPVKRHANAACFFMISAAATATRGKHQGSDPRKIQLMSAVTMSAQMRRNRFFEQMNKAFRRPLGMEPAIARKPRMISH
jgi:hypothetical protein